MELFDRIALWETFLRGGAAGLSLLTTALFLTMTPRPRAALLGGLFGVTNAAYAIISSPIVDSVILHAFAPLWLLGIFNALFFWWFATALFDDAWRWSVLKFAPAAFYAAAFLVYSLADGGFYLAVSLLHQVVNAVLFGHVIYLAVRDLRVDMVDARRRFRLAFVAVAAPIAIGVVIGETALEFGASTPRALAFLHGLSLFGATFAFAFWALKPQSALFATPAPAKPSEERASRLRPEDQPALSRLEALMADGAWREPGLTITALAEKAATPEHRLRQIINQGLGERNFAAFLNRYRLSEAKRRLADPADARTPVLTIALDVGYGSIGPFNRAFKETTGETPTEFRRRALAGAAEQS